MHAPHSLRSTRTARLLVLAVALLFSTGGAAIKSTSLSAWQVAGTRSAIAALAVLVLLPAARRWPGWRGWAVGAAYAATMIAFVVSTKLTTAANAIFLQATAPLYLVLLGPWLLREPVRRRDLGFFLLTAIGLALFFIGTPLSTAIATDPKLGNWIAAASGLTYALTIGGFRWLARGAAQGGAGGIGGVGTNAAPQAVLAGNVLAAAICLPLALPLARPSATDWMILGYLGVFQIALAYVWLTRAAPHVPALEVSLLLLVEPVLNPFWTWLVHGERPGMWAVLGGALILLSALVQAVVTRREREAPAQETTSTTSPS
jgi:drug/metabolite transporter (DMT)-like permease